MTRPKLILGVLAAACVGTLLWYAWLILAAELPRGATVATWTLWLFSAAAVVTLWAYVREFLAHRQAVGREASWKPLPGLVLLWVGGLTAMVSFAFVLPDKAPAAGSKDPAAATTPLTAQRVDSTDRATDPRSSTTSSRSTAPRPTPPAPVSTTAPQVAATAGEASSPTTSTDASTTATTTSKGSKTHPGTGSPSPKPSTSTPLVTVTLPPPPR